MWTYVHSRTQGSGVLVSANLGFTTNGPHNGSTIAVYGSYADDQPEKELSVVGGSRKFRLARGYVLIKTYSFNATTGDAILELDVYVTANKWLRWHITLYEFVVLYLFAFE